MSAFSMRWDFNDAFKGIDRLQREYPKAVKRALRKTGNSAAVAMSRAVSEDTGIGVRKVKEDMKVIPDETSVQIVILGRRLPLILFKARGPEPSRGRGRGVSYQMPGGRGIVGDAFIATMPSGHRGVFKRVAGRGRRGARPNHSELPIVELYGPSLPHVFAKYFPVGQARGQEALLTNLQSEIRFAMTR